MNFFYNPTVLVVGDVDVEKFCGAYGLFSPKVSRLDPAEFETFNDLLEAISKAIRANQPDFVLIRGEGEEVIVGDRFGILEPPEGAIVLADKKEGGMV